MAMIFGHFMMSENILNICAMHYLMPVYSSCQLVQLKSCTLSIQHCPWLFSMTISYHVHVSCMVVLNQVPAKFRHPFMYAHFFAPIKYALQIVNLFKTDIARKSKIALMVKCMALTTFKQSRVPLTAVAQLSAPQTAAALTLAPRVCRAN